jgi:cysteine desulfurase family protein
VIYLDNCSTSHPKAPGVARAVADILERGCFNTGRGTYSGAYELSELVYETRGKLARLFDAPSGRDVVFTGGVTQSINIALKGLLRAGDRVVTTQMEHNAVVRPLAQLRAMGVHVDIARCGRDGMLDMEDMDALITARTRLVVMTHASNVCGAILPIRQVGAICRERGALLLVDGAQTAGVLPISMRRDNIDILAFSAHKGLLAMPGLGGLVLSQSTADEITPLVSGGTGSYSHFEDMPPELPDKLEAGTLNLPGIAALSASLDYIESVGVDTIYARESELIAHLTDGVSALPGVRVVGPTNVAEKCAVAALDFADTESAEVTSRLDSEYGIMARCGLHCAPWAHKALGTFPRGAVRFSPGHTTTHAEIDALLYALAQITKGR